MRLGHVYRHKVACMREPMAAVAEVERWPFDRLDATVSGDPVATYLWLWRRGPDERLTVEGDAAAVRQLDARMRAATQ